MCKFIKLLGNRKIVDAFNCAELALFVFIDNVVINGYAREYTSFMTMVWQVIFEREIVD